MPTDFWFRFSTYLSLVLACLCLGYAEWQLLPEVTAFTAVVVVLLVVSFFLDRRFELSLAKANALGLGIGVGATVWMAWHLTNPPKDGPLAEIDWPTNMLPLIGPLLMTLIPAKLFRPKHVGDWWAMHGVAVAGVALASSMSDDPPFVVLMAAYAVCSAWALVLFFYRRSGGFIPPIPVPNRTPPPQAQLAPADPHARPPRWVFARTLLWLAAGAVVAVALFVALPRSGGYVWAFTKKRYVTGDTTDNKLEVNKSGELTESDEVAFRVTATDADGNPKWDVDPDQHWRTREFVQYLPNEARRQESAWAVQSVSVTHMSVGNLAAATAGDLGPGGYTLRYELEDGQKSPPVASPVRWPADLSPVKWDSGRVFPLRGSGQFVAEHRKEAYTQVAVGGDPPDVGTAFELNNDAGGNVLLQNGPEFFRDYARTLLARLIAAGRLPADATLNAREQVPDERHAQVAREFAAYFAREGRLTDDPSEPTEFTYTTTLEPKDRKIDPLEDFLKNSKAGHCEWFAGATVLLLRGVGVRSQLVIGFRGWEAIDNGDLVVRQRHAHAWVEVLVSRPTPPGFPFRPQTPEHLRGRVWQWLTVDPTPGGTVTTDTTAKNWLEQGATFIADFLLRFDKAKQEKAVEDLARAAAVGWPWAAGGLAVGVAGWLGRRWWRRWRANRPVFDGPPWYARLQAVLAARGFARTPGQTPREFADATAAAFPQAAETVQFVTSKLYRVRYAGMPLKPDEEQQVNAALDQLERTFAEGSTPLARTSGN